MWRHRMPCPLVQRKRWTAVACSGGRVIEAVGGGGATSGPSGQQSHGGNNEQQARAEGGAGPTGSTDGTSNDAGGSGAPLATSSRVLPCDVLEEAGLPCVAAHSTVRALVSGYSGPLYRPTEAQCDLVAVMLAP